MDILPKRGCRKRFGLTEGKDPQTYAIGIKELWDIEPEKSKPGTVWHSVGWPLATIPMAGLFYII